MPSGNVQGSGWGCKTCPQPNSGGHAQHLGAPTLGAGPRRRVQSPGTAARALAQGVHSLRGSR